MIYFDNAATSFPKPDSVIQAVSHYMTCTGGNPGRSGHRLSIEAGEIIFSSRRLLAEMFGIKNPMNVIMTFNTTDALNTGIQGVLKQGDHVVTTSMEHNSTARPLMEMEKAGFIELTVVQADKNGFTSPDDIKAAVRKNTSMVVMNHGSNVFGTVQPLEETGKMCLEHELVFMVDGAQTAGTVPVDMKKNCISLLACPGHKGLMGPAGTGALLINDSFDFKRIKPLRYGGTGSLSDKAEQPAFLPDRLESGTLNTPGIAGLAAGLKFIHEFPGGIQGIHAHKKALTEFFLEQAQEIPGFRTFVPAALIETGTVSFSVEGRTSAWISDKLSSEYDIMSRAGLHCAPLAHKTMGTFPDGTVRFSFGCFNTRDEVLEAVFCLKKAVLS